MNSPRPRWRILLTTTGAWLVTTLHGATLYVSPNGSDANPGTKARPLQTIEAAQERARTLRSQSRRPLQVLLRGGTYYLRQTLQFTPADSGTAKAPVVYAAYPGEQAVVSGGVRLHLQWSPFRDGIWKAQVPAGFTADQLFINGERQPLARYPNFDPAQRVFNGYAADAISPARAARWADPRGGFIHAMHKHLWGDYHYRITGKTPDGALTYEGGWQNNRQMGMHDQFRFVENIFEELDAPGEWFLEAGTGTLYFYPPAGLDLDTATIEGVRLRHLIEFNGAPTSGATADLPPRQVVRFVTFKGLTFRHAARTFMDNREPLLRSDWTTYRGGAVVFNGAEDCALQDCVFDQVGGNAVFVNNYNRRVAVRGCHIAAAGANGVAFVGDPRAVRDPLFEYGQRHNYARLDKTPGPRSDNYPADCQVEDCLIHDTGRFEKQTAPVQIAMAQRITVRHCSIYDVPRAGINIGDGCWGGHLIEFCDVFNTVLETGDHGSFNSWGRDRYWDSDIRLVNQAVALDPALPRLDMVQATILRNNRWRCDHGWDIDLDDGSSRYEIYNNLCLNGGLKNREGYQRTVENNVLVNNSFHPHVWFERSGDVFARNIVMRPYEPIGMPGVWGREIDYNLLPDAATLTKSRASQRDRHSLSGDPKFVNPAKGDFRVRHDSPALQIGFRNFPMDRFGVVTPTLRALARTPEMPRVKPPSAPGSSTGRDERVVEWLGAKIKNVVGFGEVSAAGLPSETGVRVVAVPPRSRAAAAGMRENDVILECDAQPSATVADFLRAVRAAPPGRRLKLGVFRQQRLETLELEVSKP